MNYNDPTLIEELAAQYALGTLRGPARRHFERLCRENGAAMAAVHRWEDRQLDLAAQVVAVRPSPEVWTAVQRRLGHRTSVRSSWWATPMRWAVAAGVAAFALLIAWRTLLTPQAHLVATIADQQQTQMWRIEGRGRETLIVSASQALPQDAQHAYELWALPTQPGGAPVSLGLMPQSGQRSLPLSDAQRAALANARQVAISLEPPSGSPTGAPTGPVLFVADIARG
jgi:anti-sigma-K factor RskA